MTDDIEQQLVAIVQDTVRMSDVQPTRDTVLADLGIASLDMVEMIFAIEERFDIEVPYNANDAAGEFTFTTFGEVVEGVRALVERRTAVV